MKRPIREAKSPTIVKVERRTISESPDGQRRMIVIIAHLSNGKRESKTKHIRAHSALTTMPLTQLKDGWRDL